MTKRLLSSLLSFALVFTTINFLGFLELKTDAAGGEVSVSGSKMELYIGEERVVSFDINGSFDKYYYPLRNEEYGIIYTDIGGKYEVWGGRINNDGIIEALVIQPLCANQISFDGIRVVGAGDFAINMCKKTVSNNETMEDNQLKVTLNAYNAPGEIYDGYAVYSELLSEEEGGNRSDKIHIEFSDGCMVTDERNNVTSSSTVQVNGTIRTTSFCISDITEMNFGSDEAPVDDAFELVYQQDNNEEWDKDSYYEIEINGANIDAFVTDSFLNKGRYEWDNFGEKQFSDISFKSLWVYNEAVLSIIDNDNASEDLVGATEYMRVMTGGKITARGGSAISIPAAKTSYFVETGAIREIEHNGERITEFAITKDCILDKETDGYDETANPTPNKDTAGRYIYTKAEDDTSFELISTGKSLEIVSVAGNISHGKFQIEAGSGLINDNGDFWAERDTEVKFTLVPDAGYQYKAGSFTANDYPVTDNVLFKATDIPGVYMYTMGKNAIYINCEFEEARDDIEVNAGGVNGASIDMGENEYSGTMEFIVNDGKLTEEESESVDSCVKEGNVIGATLDLSLSNKIDTITGEDAWETNITELESDMKVTVQMDDTIGGNSDYEVIRIHNGKTDVIPADEVDYNPADESLSFSTDRYSSYVISYKKAEHSFSYAWSSDSQNHWHSCIKCQEKRDIAPHKLGNVTTKATTSKNGKTDTKCSVCGRITRTSVIYYPKTVSLSSTSYAYNGKEHKPTVTVTDSKGKKLSASNYTLSYLNTSGKTVTPKSVGAYTVRITFKGNYSGTVSKAFRIVPKTTTVATPSVSYDGITVKWTKNTTCTGYYIYRSINGRSYTKVKTVKNQATTSWKDTAAKTNGNRYSYKLIAYKNVGGKSYNSSYSSVKTVYFLTRPSVSGLTNSGAKRMTVKWGRNSKVTGYQIQYSLKSDFSKYKSVTVKGKSTLSKNVGGLSGGKTYYVRVRSYKTVGSTRYYSAWSTKKSVKIKK